LVQEIAGQKPFYEMHVFACNSNIQERTAIYITTNPWTPKTKYRLELKIASLTRFKEFVYAILYMHVKCST
jgi:hypothetical protein